MGSELHVRSAEGQGTTFWFNIELPIVEDITETEDFSTVIPSRHIIGYKGSRRKVLLVDDNEKNRAVLRDMLLPLEFDIVEAKDGKDALEKAGVSFPDMILMDLIMPVMDGIEATQIIRKSPELKDIIVIGISASAFNTTKQTSFKAGCNDFLTKPIHIEKLLNCLQMHLKLEWIYEEISTADSVEKEIPEIKEEAVPAKEDLDALLEFAEISHITGVQKIIEKIKNENDKYLPFVTKIEDLLENFQFKRIIEIIRSHQ
jgi:CheY-like chemotaxis protein